MGPWPSRQAPLAPKGCWTMQWSTMDFTVGQTETANFANLLNGDWLDCDCVAVGLCKDGEPPIPPMTEFLNDVRLNPAILQEKQPETLPHPVLPSGHTYRPPPSRNPYVAPIVHGVPSGSTYDVSKNPFGFGRRVKRALGILQSSRGSQAVKSKSVSPRAVSPWAFSRAVVRAYHSLSPIQQNTILHHWPAFEPIARNLTQNFNPETQELDPRPVMAILLGGPAGPGGDVVRLMNRKWANFLIQCAWQSFYRHTPSIRGHLKRLSNASSQLREKKECETKAREKAKEGQRVHLKEMSEEFMSRRKGMVQHLDNVFDDEFPNVDTRFPEGEEEDDGPKGPDELSSEYLDIFVYFQEALWANLPSPLSLKSREKEKFMLSQDGNLDKMKQTKGRAVIHQFLDMVSSSMQQPNTTFVADVDDVVASIYQQLQLFGNQNPYLKSLDIRTKLDSLDHKLDWREETLVGVFNETLPQLQLTMSFFSLSIWAGLSTY